MFVLLGNDVFIRPVTDEQKKILSNLDNGEVK